MRLFMHVGLASIMSDPVFFLSLLEFADSKDGLSPEHILLETFREELLNRFRLLGYPQARPGGPTYFQIFQQSHTKSLMFDDFDRILHISTCIPRILQGAHDSNPRFRMSVLSLDNVQTPERMRPAGQT